MSDEILIVDWLQQREQLSDEQVEALLSRCQAEPGLSRRVKELLLIDEALSRLFDAARQDFGNRVRKGLTMRQSQRLFAVQVSAAARQRVHQQQGPWSNRWAWAATFLLTLGGMTIWFATREPSLPPPQMQTVVQQPQSVPLTLEAGSAHVVGVDGRIPVTGDARIQTPERLQVDPGARVHLHLGEGSTVTCDGGELVLIGDAASGWRIELLRGSLTGNLPARLPAPLTVSTASCLVTVTGTVFSVDADVDGSSIAVTRGSVSVLDTQRNRHQDLHAGQALRITSVDLAAQPEILATIIDGSPQADGWVHLSRDEAPARLYRGEMHDGRQTWAIDFSDNGSWLALVFQTHQDWSAADGLLLHLRGSGDGSLVAIEIADSSLPIGGERFIATFADSAEGWRTIILPWSAFGRRDWQPDPHAPDDGLSLSAISLLGTFRIGANKGRLLIDQAALYRR